MKTEVKKLDRGRGELTIELSPEEYQPFLEIAAKSISENIKIPGFRPGKAGFDLIQKRVGEAEIWQEALEAAVKKTFLKALKEQKLVTVGSPQIDVIKLAPKNPVIYKATISVLPNVELEDLTKIKIAKKEIKVDEKEVKKAMADLQKMHAKETLADRKSKKGDKIEIDFETILDNIPIESGIQKAFPLVIGEGGFIPGFEEKLIDLGKDEEKTFQLKFPDNYHQKNFAGRLVDFKVKMNSVYNLDLPELNDEFAKSLGQFNMIKEIEDKIRENLKIEIEEKEKQNLEGEIIDKIINLSKFDDIPDILIDSEAKKMIDELEHNLSHQGLKFEDYLNHLKKTREDLLLDFTSQAIKRVKSALVLRKVEQTQKIQATEQEIDEEVKKIKTIYGNDPEVEKNLNNLAYRGYLRNVLTARKVIDYLKSIIVK